MSISRVILYLKEEAKQYINLFRMYVHQLLNRVKEREYILNTFFFFGLEN